MIAETAPLGNRGRRRAVPAAAIAHALPAAAAVAIVAVRIRQMGDFPTGPDGGSWLALGRDLLGGPGRATPGSYAPLTPIITAAAATLLGPVSAVWVVAAAASAALLGALAVVAAKTAKPIAATMFVLAVGGSSAMAEPLFFGGYPQLVATAGLLLAVWLFASWLVGGRHRAVIGGVAALLVAAASHHVYGVFAIAAVGALVLAWIAVRRPDHGTARARIAPVFVAGCLAAGLLGRAWTSMRVAGYSPPLEAVAFTASEAWSYATRDAVAIWTAGLVVGFAALWWTRDAAHPAWLTAFALLAVFVPAMATVAEPRLVAPILIGVGLALALLAERARLPALGGCLAVAAFVVAIGGHRASQDFARFYAVLDRSTVAAAAAVEAASPVGLVAVRADRRDWPVGWWFEGLTTAPIAVGSDPRWLGYPGERAAAETVADLFALGGDAASLRELSARNDVDLLVARKWEWIGWERWLADPDPPVEVVFDDDVTIVLRLRATASRGGSSEDPGV